MSAQLARTEIRIKVPGVHCVRCKAEAQSKVQSVYEGDGKYTASMKCPDGWVDLVGERLTDSRSLMIRKRVFMCAECFAVVDDVDHLDCAV